MLDAVVQLAVKDRHLTAPPGAPDDGDRYIVAAGATGAWVGQAQKIAAWQDGAWAFLAPAEGFRAWVEDEDALLIFDGAAWVDVGSAIHVLQNLSLLGIGTTADAANPFSAKLNKALWTAKTAAEGGDGDLRYTMNKETAADVLSLLLQTGFSGRAELGLIGDDDFALKVSANGSAWAEAMRIDKDDGSVILDGPGVLPHFLIGTATPRANIANSAGLTQTPTFQKIATTGASASFAFVCDIANAAAAAKIQVCKGAAAGAAISNADRLAEFLGEGSDGTNYLPAAGVRSWRTAALFRQATSRGDSRSTPIPAAMRSRNAFGSTRTAISGWAAPTSSSTQSRHFRLRSYTIAGLPSASPAGQMIFCSDLGGGGGQLNSDGTSWRRVSRGGQQAVATDAAFTLTPLTSAEEQKHTGTLTANRVVTLSTTNAYAGARFRITRTGGGAFALDIGGLKNLATNTWGEVIYDGSAWYLAASGAL